MAVEKKAQRADVRATVLGKKIGGQKNKADSHLRCSCPGSTQEMRLLGRLKITPFRALGTGFVALLASTLGSQ